MSSSVPVFRKQYLRENSLTDDVEMITSPAARTRGNEIVVSVLVIQRSGSNDTTIALDATYDGTAWLELATTTVQGFGYYSFSETGVDASSVRIRAEVGAFTSVLLDATIAFSDQ